MDDKKRWMQNLFRYEFNDLVTSTHPLKNIKAIEAIKGCRTAEMGVSYFTCRDRHEVYERAHSCRHRSCPLCSEQSKQKWIEAEKSRLFDCPHYHVVFTVPHEYRVLWHYNEAWFTRTLFKLSSDTLLTLLKNKKHGGLTPGILMSLHTWGRQLNWHAHTHCLVTAGGLDQGDHWKSLDEYLLPIRLVKRFYRSRFQSAVRDAFVSGELQLPPDQSERQFWQSYRQVYKKEWSVRIEERYDHGKGVMLYLSRYLRGGPLNPEQLQSCNAKRVSFKYKDHRENRIKTLELKRDEFTRRVLLHVPVTGMHTVRHYGLYASAAKPKRERCCQVWGTISKGSSLSSAEVIEKVLLCKVCGNPAKRTHSIWRSERKGISLIKESAFDLVQQDDEAHQAKELRSRDPCNLVA